MGDTWARYEVRLIEMRESTKIIQQALDGMPGGPVKADAPKIVLPDREKMKTQMEALIHHFKIVTEGFAVPAGEVYQGIECGHGQMGYYVVSDGTAKPYRVHMRYPSFATLQAVETMCKGGLIADLVAVIGSIDIVLGEIDRLTDSVLNLLPPDALWSELWISLASLLRSYTAAHGLHGNRQARVEADEEVIRFTTKKNGFASSATAQSSPGREKIEAAEAWNSRTPADCGAGRAKKRWIWQQKPGHGS